MKRLSEPCLPPMVGLVATGIDTTTTRQLYEIEADDVGKPLPGYLGVAARSVTMAAEHIGRRLCFYGGHGCWAWEPAK